MASTLIFLVYMIIILLSYRPTNDVKPSAIHIDCTHCDDVSGVFAMVDGEEQDTR